MTMLRRFYVALHLLVEAGAARRDARVRFLKAQVEILRHKLGGNRVIPSPDDRARLLAIGRELDYNVADVIGIVTPHTYCRWVAELREGRRPKRVGRPKIARNMRELVVRLARENAGWGYRHIVGELHQLRLPVGRSSVRRVLKDAGLTPSPDGLIQAALRGALSEAQARQLSEQSPEIVVLGLLAASKRIAELQGQSNGQQPPAGLRTWKYVRPTGILPAVLRWFQTDLARSGGFLLALGSIERFPRFVILSSHNIASR